MEFLETSTLKHCVEQLAPVLTDIFNSSLELQSVPAPFKSSIIVPVPKGSNPKTLNDFRPVALTSVVMKVFERLVLKYLKSVTETNMDPLQFAFRSNRGVDDAVAMALHSILQHLEHTRTYARILFVDFSSAFNTILPQRLYDKLLNNFGLDHSICKWILDFLLEREQVVRMNDIMSDPITLNTGAPQGCVLSPMLFSLYTNDCATDNPSAQRIKFADDTTMPGLISNADESAYRSEVDNLVSWCDQNNLELNTGKTQEVLVDFRRKREPVQPLSIKGEEIKQVSHAKFLGTTIASNLSWEQNCSSIKKKAHQRLYFLRQLKKFRMRREILYQFYKASIESILTFSICVWFGGLSFKDRAALDRIIKVASKIIGSELPSLEELFIARSTKKASKILRDSSHPANHFFELLPSGRRFRTFKARTNRFKNSFYPQAISLMNSK